MRCVCKCWQFCNFENICELTLTTLGDRAIDSSRCWIVALLDNKYRLFGSVSGLGEVLDESCCKNVENEHALELEDNPWTTTGTKFLSCTELFSHSWSDLAFDHLPTRRKNRVLRRTCLLTGRRRVFEYLHRHEELNIVNVYL